MFEVCQVIFKEFWKHERFSGMKRPKLHSFRHCIWQIAGTARLLANDVSAVKSHCLGVLVSTRGRQAAPNGGNKETLQMQRCHWEMPAIKGTRNETRREGICGDTWKWRFIDSPSSLMELLRICQIKSNKAPKSKCGKSVDLTKMTQSYSCWWSCF